MAFHVPRRWRSVWVPGCFCACPFFKINYLPLTTFRIAPGSIFKKTAKRLGIEVQKRKFSDPEAAEEELDRLLEAGRPVGAQTGVFWLPFFPPAYRFHFNAHNLVVIGKEGDDYLISDPIFEETVRCPAADLRKARFARGRWHQRGKFTILKRCRTGSISKKRLNLGSMKSVGRC